MMMNVWLNCESADQDEIMKQICGSGYLAVVVHVHNMIEQIQFIGWNDESKDLMSECRFSVGYHQS